MNVTKEQMEQIGSVINHHGALVEFIAKVEHKLRGGKLEDIEKKIMGWGLATDCKLEDMLDEISSMEEAVSDCCEEFGGCCAVDILNNIQELTTERNDAREEAADLLAKQNWKQHFDKDLRYGVVDVRVNAAWVRQILEEHNLQPKESIGEEEVYDNFALKLDKKINEAFGTGVLRDMWQEQGLELIESEWVENIGEESEEEEEEDLPAEIKRLKDLCDKIASGGSGTGVAELKKALLADLSGGKVVINFD